METYVLGQLDPVLNISSYSLFNISNNQKNGISVFTKEQERGSSI